MELERMYVAREKAMGNLGHPGRDVQKGVARGLELSGMSLGWWCQAYWSISRQRLSREEGGARTHGIYFLYRLGSREEAKYTSCLDSLHPLVWLSRDHRSEREAVINSTHTHTCNRDLFFLFIY